MVHLGDVAPSSPPDPPDPPKDEPGPIETAVAADLERIGSLNVGMRGAHAVMARKLARALDNASVSDVTELAKINQELRQTLARLTTVDSDDQQTLTGFFRFMSTPVRDPADPGAPDAGATCRRCGGDPR